MSLFKGLCSVIFLCLLSVPAWSAKSVSIDPSGKYFLQRLVGDTYHCGPLAALIARKYADSRFQVTQLESEIFKARGLVNEFKKSKREEYDLSWWEIDDIKTYLQFMGVSVKEEKLKRGRNQYDQLLAMIENDSMVIVNVNMNHFPYGQETGKPYRTFYIPGGWGHYLAIVGYEQIEGKTYFKVHDSFSPKGKNRLYLAERVIRSMQRFEPIYLQIKQGV